MNFLEHERYGMIRLFETYILAVSRLVEHDGALFGWRRNRVAICHRIATHLQEGLFGTFSLAQRQRYVVDMGASLLEDPQSLVADIVVHDRGAQEPHRLMAIVCREGYLTESELLGLHELKVKGNCELTLAMAFLPQKDYMLIYRADETSIDYYHFLREEKHCQLLKRRQIGDVHADGRQLKLGIKDGRGSSPPR
ncbi:MAG: hypothetical protein WCY74_09505 [Sphaerochaetaceae bacterium]